MARVRESGDVRKPQIVRAALEILSELGPRHLTARALGERVGIDNSTVFRHFANKAAIIDGALDEFEAALDGSIPDDAPSFDALRTFFLRRLSLVKKRPEIIRLAFNDQLFEAAGEKAHAQRVRKIVRRTVKFIRAAVKEAQISGELSAEIPAEALGWVVVGILRGAALGSMKPKPSPEQAWNYLESVLRATQRPSGVKKKGR